MNFSEVAKKLEGQKYPKEIDLGQEKLIFYYNNKSKAEDGGVFVYRVSSKIKRPERRCDLVDSFAQGRTSAYSGVPNYTMNLHKNLFDTRNRLF